MKITVPKNSLPKGTEQEMLNVNIAMLGDHFIGDENQVVSPIHWVDTKIKFKKKIGFEIQHAAMDARHLFFLKVSNEESSEQDTPQSPAAGIMHLDGGKFGQHSNIGAIATETFSGLAIAAPIGTKISMISKLFYDETDRYGYPKNIAFVITLNLEILLSVRD